MTQSFSVVSDFKATGDQPEAIKHLSKGVGQGLKHQTKKNIKFLSQENFQKE